MPRPVSARVARQSSRGVDVTTSATSTVDADAPAAAYREVREDAAVVRQRKERGSQVALRRGVGLGTLELRGEPSAEAPAAMDVVRSVVHLLQTF